MTEPTLSNSKSAAEIKAKIDSLYEKMQKEDAQYESMNALMDAKSIVAQEAVDASTAADAHAENCVREALKHQRELTDIAVRCQQINKSLIESNQTIMALKLQLNALGSFYDTAQ